MYNFELKVPTEIIFGVDVEEKAGELMKKYADRVMMVYGSERIFKTGLGSKITDSLEKAGCSVVLCGGVKPNAEVQFIRKAIEMARENKIDGILAVGGGSTIDTAKAISAGVNSDADIMDIYRSNLPVENFLPIGAVVTIPATASESNGMSVISCDETQEKIAWFSDNAKPKFALLNPLVTLTVNPYQTAIGGFDIFSHAFERYFDLTRNSMVLDGMTESVMKSMVTILPQVISDPENVQLRSDIMLAASVAHNDMLGPGGDFGCHQISHVITEEYGVPHGEAMAMIVPAWCEVVSEKNEERFSKFFSAVFGTETENRTNKEIIRSGIEEMKNFISSIGLSLKVDAETDKIEEIAEKIIQPAGFTGCNFTKLYKDDVVKILNIIISVVA